MTIKNYKCLDCGKELEQDNMVLGCRYPTIRWKSSVCDECFKKRVKEVMKAKSSHNPKGVKKK